MEFIVKRTTELTYEEKIKIRQLFNDVFHQKRDVKSFDKQFLNNILGYSFHSLAIDNNEIIGALSSIPFYCYKNGEKLLFGVSADVMVAKPYRDLYNVLEIIKNQEKVLKNEGIVFLMGFPNENSRQVFNIGRKFKDVGRMYSYAMPYKIGGVKKYLKIFNPLSIILSWSLILLSKIFTGSPRTRNYKFIKDNNDFLKYRYQWFDNEYKIVKINPENYFTYSIKLYNNIRTVFLIDITNTSKKTFQNAVNYIFKHHRKEFDVILYVGHLPFRPINMIKIPHYLEPKRFSFHGKILNKEVLDESVFDIKNWHVNLSNYDLI